jgi:hypothetical protein
MMDFIYADQHSWVPASVSFTWGGNSATVVCVEEVRGI